MLEIEWTTNGVTQVIDFDVAVTTSFEAPAEITEHAVEQGASVSDHIRPGNDTITVEAWVSNTPIVSRSFGLNGAAGATQSTRLPDGKHSASVFTHSTTFDRVKSVDDALLALRDAGQLLTLRTSLREVENLAIQSYKVTRDAETGNVLAVVLELRKVRIASTQRVRVTEPTQRRGQNTRNRGNQPANPTSSSALTRIFDSLSGGS